MNRTPVTLGILLAVGCLTAVGVGLAAVAHLAAGSARAQASRFPELVRWIPADSGFVAYVDLAAVLESPLREPWEKRQTERYFNELEQFRSLTGIDPRRDLRAACFAAGLEEAGEKPAEKEVKNERGVPSRWGLAVSGNFQPELLVAAIEQQLARPESQAASARLEKSAYRSTTLYLLRLKEKIEGQPSTQALAFPDTATALFGAPERVKAMLDAGAGRVAPFAASALGRWLDEMSADDAFWVAGSAEAGIGRLWRQPVGSAPPLPPLKYFALSARFGSSLEAFARGEASDPESARKLADVVRGFIALGSLQQPQKPELAALLNAVQIVTAENRVEISLAIPYEMLERLASAERKTEAQQ